MKTSTRRVLNDITDCMDVQYRMSRHKYVPREAGCIVLTDMWHTRLAVIDCSSGGAQVTFDDLVRSFQNAGWEFGVRYFDNVYMRRGGVRWEMRIGERLPEPQGVGWGMQFPGSRGT